jgi:hypothetical protein
VPVGEGRCRRWTAGSRAASRMSAAWLRLVLQVSTTGPRRRALFCRCRSPGCALCCRSSPALAEGVGGRRVAAAASGRRGLQRAARDRKAGWGLCAIGKDGWVGASHELTMGSWGGSGRCDEDGGSGGRGGTRWWLGGRVEVELGRVRVSLGMGFWTVLPCWDECTFCSVLCSVNRELTGNFGSRGTGTEQEPIFSVPVLSVPVPGSFGSVLGFSCLGLAVVARARSTGTSPGKKKKKNRGLSYLESGLECLISSRQTIQDKW